ncbi:MAG: hypothetical protein ACKOX6_05055 [Bdellovibrio sp.]
MTGALRLFRIYILIFFFASCLAQGAEHPEVKITYPTDGSPMLATKEFIRASYESIGYEVVFKKRPADKALTYLENRIFDGDLVRSKGVEKADKILRVDVPLAQLKIFMVTLKNHEAPPTLKGIKKENRAAILYGCPVAERLLSGVTSEITRVSLASEIESLVLAGQVDFALSADKLKNPHNSLTQTVVHLEDVYHVVSASRKNLIPSLEIEFKKRLSEGIKEQIQQEVSP